MDKITVGKFIAEQRKQLSLTQKQFAEQLGVTLDPSVSGNICTVISKSNGNVTIEAYAVNKNGNTIVNEKDGIISDRKGITSEVNLWLIIVHCIRRMLSATNTAINSLL